MVEPEKKKPPQHGASMVALVLAVGVAVGLNVITFAILLAAWARLGVDVDSGISENGTQLLTAIFSGCIGALSAFLGFTLGKRSEPKDEPVPEEPPPEPPG